MPRMSHLAQRPDATHLHRLPARVKAMAAAAAMLTIGATQAQASPPDQAVALALVAATEPASEWLAQRAAGSLAPALAVMAASEDAAALLRTRQAAALDVALAKPLPRPSSVLVVSAHTPPQSR